MMRIRVVLCLTGALLAVGLAFLTNSNKTAENTAEAKQNAVQIFRSGGQWKARFDFAQDAPVWAFERSALTQRDERSWRSESWTIETPGVTLERIGIFDTFVAEGRSVPREVVISFRPLNKDLIADYSPAIIMSDGSLAIFGGHFTAFPLESRELPEDLEEPRDFSSLISLTADDAPVLFKGELVSRAEDIGSHYVYIGDIKLAANTSVVTILDPGLPNWISTQLIDFTPMVFSSYNQKMGQHKSIRPMVMVSWAGAEAIEQGVSGSVSSGLIAMRIGSRRLLNETPSERRFMQWFIAHEAAHFWLGDTIGYKSRDDMWITEGGADFLAMSMMAKQDPEFDSRGFFANARTDCAASLQLGTLAGALKRNDQQAAYTCGFLFALVVDRAGQSRGEGFGDFVHRLIVTNTNGQVSAHEWLVAARAFGVDSSQITLLEAMIRGHNTDPLSMIESLLSDVHSTPLVKLN